jgi:uncharacterized membrane protein
MVMKELTFLNNKTKKELYKYTFVALTTVITWLLQISIISNFQFFEVSPNLLLLACIFMGQVFGPVNGFITGLIISFLSAGVIYNHIFYLSYPLVGLLSAFILKNVFSYELFSYLILCFILSFPCELLNYLQYCPPEIKIGFGKIASILFISSLQNVISGLLFYFLMTFISKKLKLMER